MKKILIAILILLQIVGFVLSWPSFYYYPRSGNSPVILSASGSLSNTGFDPNSATVFIVHGYTSSASNPAFQLMKTAFNSYTNVNTILVDWAAGAAGPPSGEISIDQYYIAAVSNLKPLGQNISAFISVNNIEPNSVVCIGHSLGAHGCGMAGKTYYSQKGKKLGRISGLDPAGPLFVNLTTNKLVGAKKRLDDSDATYVDCILTSPFLGIVKPICRANFYPNQLNGQPQCAANDYSCQHSAAIGYYIASIPGATNCKFISKRCASYQTQCSMCSAVNPNKCIQMGWFASSYQSANGTFVLNTQANQPYCVN